MPFIPIKAKTLALTTALLSLGALGCGGSSSPPPSDAEQIEAAADELRQVVLEMEIAPEDRVDLLALLERYERTAKEGIDLRQDYVTRWVVLAQDYDSSSEDFDALLAEHSVKRRELVQRLVALRVAAASHCTGEQWAALAHARSHRIDVQLDAARRMFAGDEDEAEDAPSEPADADADAREGEGV